MTDTQAAKFEGWAVVELFGHQREAGYITTQYFGNAAMFQLDVPSFPERERTLTAPNWVNDRLCPTGTVITEGPTLARTRLINPSAVYAMNPCTEETAKRAIEQQSPRPIVSIAAPEGKQLPPQSNGTGKDHCGECGWPIDECVCSDQGHVLPDEAAT